MQTYAPSTVSSTHHRSVSLCNYDELCRTRKQETDVPKRKMMPLLNYAQEPFDDNLCEYCPVNFKDVCEKDHTHITNNSNNSNNKNDNEEEFEVNIKISSNNSNTINVSNNNHNQDNRSTIIDINNDQSLKLLFFPLKFSCSSSCFIFPDHHWHPHQPKLSTPTVKGHRRSLSLRQQFEYGYDYFLAEFEHAREFAGKTVTHATKTVSQATGAVWKVCHFSMLPKWMQDNEYLHTGHRPPLPTFWACIKSIFRLHTETGNIWTHGLGALMFLGLFIYEFVTISAHKTAIDRLMLTIYFCGIIMCLLFSCLFHTFSCYASPKVIKIFSKLDYCGISLQIIGSMTPALYYGFYEDLDMFKLYISFGIVLCILSIAVSLWDKFGEPRYRSFRAMVFLCFGLSNVIPGVHWYIILDSRLLTAYYLFILQGALYVIGSLLYANRIPERLFPGKCDYMFQSHQIFHVLVVLAALVHLNGINSMAEFRMHHRNHTLGDII